jgi:hypothetical protein
VNYPSKTSAPIAQGLSAPKAASPLQREIGQLAETVGHTAKITDELFEKLRPLFQQTADPPNNSDKEPDAISEVPQMVRSHRTNLAETNRRLEWLLGRLEV